MAHTVCPGGPFMMTQVVLGDHLCRGTSQLVTDHIGSCAHSLFKLDLLVA